MRLPIVAVILSFLFSFLVDFYIWCDLRQSKSKARWKLSNIHAFLSIALWIFLIVAVSLPRRDLDGGVYTVMWMLTTYLSIYVSKFIYCIFSLIGRIPTIFRRNRWNWTKYAGAILGIGAFGSVWYGIAFVRNHTQTVEIELYSDNLPESFDGYRIVQISDLHLGTWGTNTDFIKAMVGTINALNPDLIVFTGDIVNQKSDEMIPFVEVLSHLSAKDGVYSILGNHDYGDYVDWPTPSDKAANLQMLKDLQKKAGWHMLNNDHVFLRRGTAASADSIALIGVENWGEPPFGQYGDLDKAYAIDSIHSLKDSNFKILLTHNPEHWVRYVRQNSNIDLSLSGHTHAMQMSVNAFGRRWSPSALRYPTWGGFYTEDEDGEIKDFGNPSTSGGLKRDLDQSSLYVNIGAGEVAMPYRIGSSFPEITLITLKRKK